jgi:transposase
LDFACHGHDAGMGKHFSHQRPGLNGDVSTDALGRDFVREPARLSRAAKLAIVAESFADGAGIADVARRHGIKPQRLFAWRSAARAKLRPQLPDPSAAPPLFVPALVGINGRGKGAAHAVESMPIAPAPDATATIEIVLGDAVIRVRGLIDAVALCAVLKALKAAS